MAHSNNTPKNNNNRITVRIFKESSLRGPPDLESGG